MRCIVIVLSDVLKDYQCSDASLNTAALKLLAAEYFEFATK